MKSKWCITCVDFQTESINKTPESDQPCLTPLFQSKNSEAYPSFIVEKVKPVTWIWSEVKRVIKRYGRNIVGWCEKLF